METSIRKRETFVHEKWGVTILYSR